MSRRIIIFVFVGTIAFAIITGLVIRFLRIPKFSQVQFFEVKKGAIKTDLKEEVTLKAAKNLQLSFENGGKIENIFVSVGDQVKKGQVLAEIENSDYLVSLQRVLAERKAAEAQLEQAREDVDIQKAKLQSLKNADAKKYDIKAQKETKDKSQSGVDVQEALLSAAQNQVEEASLQLAKTRLIAPMDGVITEKSFEAGEVVQQAISVLKIASANSLEASAYVSELDVKKISIGMPARISISSTDGKRIALDSKIENIYPSETNQNGVSSYKVVFELASQNEDLKSGMTGNANIEISRQSESMVVPQSSIFSDAGKKYVMVISGGFPERKEVQIGVYGSDGTAEILSGISEGDKIIKFQ